MTAKLEVRKTKDARDFAFCVSIRHAVFVEEQACPVIEEYDAFEDICIHYIALKDGVPVGTARWRVYNGKGKIERVAVLSSGRGLGVAKALMTEIIEEIALQNIGEIILSAQDQAAGLYEKLGFETYGDGYMEAGIPHHMMKKIL